MMQEENGDCKKTEIIPIYGDHQLCLPAEGPIASSTLTELQFSFQESLFPHSLCGLGKPGPTAVLKEWESDSSLANHRTETSWLQ